MSEIVVSRGGKATFSCELPDNSYTGKWFQNGKELQHDGKRFSISQDNSVHSLVIAKAEKQDEGKIVFKTNKGNVEVPFNLIVTEPPFIDQIEFDKCAQALNQLKTGTPMVLKVPFSGAAGIKATWKFNGSVITSGGRRKIVTTANSSTLTVDSFQEEDCGSYEITLENKHGNMRVPIEVSLSDESGVEFKTITVPGETIQKTTTMTLESGAGQVEVPSKPSGNIKFDNMSSNNFTISFVTTAKGNDIEIYIIEVNTGDGVWKKCATFKPGDKSIKIDNMTEGKRCTFRIKATNASGESEGLESRAITVQKPSNPPLLDAGVVEKLKGVQHLKSGKDFRLKIPYSGFPLPIAQWSKDGKKLAAKGRILSETSDVDTTFGISGLGAPDSGEYTLLLKNKSGNATLSFNILIIDAPSAPVGPLDMTDVTSTEMTFSWQPPKSDGGCPLEGYIIEQKDTKSPSWMQIGKVGPDVLSYTATGLKKGLKYSYRIKAFSSEGESKPLISPLVLASGPPGEPGEPKPTKVSSTNIEIAWGAPENDGGSSVTAYVVEMRQDGGDWTPLSSSNVKNLTAKVADVVSESDYDFRVCAKNSTGKGPWRQTDTPITAMDAPEPPFIAESVKKNLAQPVTFQARDDVLVNIPVSGIPKPTATWTYNGKPVAADDKRILSKVEKGKAELRIPGANRSDSGKYEVLLKNSEGEATASVNVNVQDVPSAPDGPLKILKASSKSITIGWNAPADDGGMHVTQYVIEKQVIVDGDWTKLGKVFPGEQLTATADQLTKGKSYIFRVNASNNLGSSPYLTSAEVVADDKYKPPAGCAAPSVSDITKSSCVVTWEAPDDGGSPIYGYMVEMKRIGRRNWIPLNGGRSVAETSFKVKDLTQENEYQFRVTAENEGGSGPAGQESETITAKDPIPPPPPPSDLRILDKTDKSVLISWISPSDLNPEFFSGYYIEKCLEGTGKWEKCNISPIRAPKYTITGLSTGSKYRFRVRPYNDGGYGEACALEEFTEVRQMQEKPHIAFDSSIPQSIEVHASGTLKLMATFTGKPAPAIRWEKDGSDLEKRGMILTNDGVTQLTIRNLAKNDTGVYTLHATNQSGEITRQVKVVVKDSPDPPCNIKLGELQDDGSLVISWDPPRNDGGNPIKHYCLQKRDAYSRSFQTIKDKITGTSYTVRDLKPGYTYYFRVIAENEHGRGDGNQSNLLTVVQRRGPLNIERVSYGKMNFNKAAAFNLALKPIAVKERSSARFTCAVVGKPDPEISWYKDGTRIKPNNKYSMRNSYGVCTLQISDCRARDAGMYKCQCVNPSGKAVSEANLSVYGM